MRTFTQALYDEATTNGWIMMSMQKDWNKVFAFSPTGAAVYHLGHYGTAAKKLKQFDLKH